MQSLGALQCNDNSFGRRKLKNKPIINRPPFNGWNGWLYSLYITFTATTWLFWLIYTSKELRQTPERAQAIRNTGSVRQMPGSQGHQPGQGRYDWTMTELWQFQDGKTKPLKPPQGLYTRTLKNGEIGSLGMGFYMGLPDSFKRGLQWS